MRVVYETREHLMVTEARSLTPLALSKLMLRTLLNPKIARDHVCYSSLPLTSILVLVFLFLLNLPFVMITTKCIRHSTCQLLILPLHYCSLQCYDSVNFKNITCKVILVWWLESPVSLWNFSEPRHRS